MKEETVLYVAMQRQEHAERKVTNASIGMKDVDSLTHAQISGVTLHMLKDYLVEMMIHHHHLRTTLIPQAFAKQIR